MTAQEQLQEIIGETWEVSPVALVPMQLAVDILTELEKLRRIREVLAEGMRDV